MPMTADLRRMPVRKARWKYWCSVMDDATADRKSSAKYSKP